jgi:hypothetical protein
MCAMSALGVRLTADQSAVGMKLTNTILARMTVSQMCLSEEGQNLPDSQPRIHRAHTRVLTLTSIKYIIVLGIQKLQALRFLDVGCNILYRSLSGLATTRQVSRSLAGDGDFLLKWMAAAKICQCPARSSASIPLRGLFQSVHGANAGPFLWLNASFLIRIPNSPAQSENCDGSDSAKKPTTVHHSPPFHGICSLGVC